MEDTAIPYKLPEAENHSFFSLTSEWSRASKPNFTDTMRGNCIMSFMDRATVWQAIRCSRLLRAMWH